MAKSTRLRRKRIGAFPAKVEIFSWKKGDDTGFTLDLKLFAGPHTLKINTANNKAIQDFLNKDEEDED